MLEQHRREMEQYADYRNYLSFSMYEQVTDADGNVIRENFVDDMAGRDSGGEGQNPKYVALLAGFAMLYMQQTNRDSRITLVLLDEAFSTMDQERSAVCLKYARQMDLQLIVCVPDERLQSKIAPGSGDTIASPGHFFHAAADCEFHCLFYRTEEDPRSGSNFMFLPGNRDDCINRRFNFVSPLIALQFPVGTDQTMAGAIGAGKPAEAFVGKRRDRNLFIGGIAVKRTDSGGVSIYPVSDCAVSVMIIGIHVAGPEIAVSIIPSQCSQIVVAPFVIG